MCVCDGDRKGGRAIAQCSEMRDAECTCSTAWYDEAKINMTQQVYATTLMERAQASKA